MILGRVVGNVVSTHKDPGVEDVKLLLVEKIDVETNAGKGDYLVAMDGVGAGPGDLALIVSGGSARMTELTTGRPCDATIMAIVDLVSLRGETIYNKANS